MQSPKWLGRCPDCGQWGALVEETVTVSKGGRVAPAVGGTAPQRLHEVSVVGEERRCSGFGEFDRVLGGGT
ncbi:MAG: DNA repair protein RadA, partial [Desulfuromonadales bacterium]